MLGVPLGMCVDWLMENMVVSEGFRSSGLPHLSVRVGNDVYRAKTYAELRQMVTSAVGRAIGS